MGHKKSKAQPTFLDERVIDQIVRNTQFDANEVNALYQGFIRDCPDGLLTQRILERTYNELSPTGNASQFCRVIMNAFDLNDDGAINFEEYALIMALIKSGNVSDSFRLAFRMFDRDHNGYLEKKELRNTLRAIIRLNGETETNDTINKRCDQIMEQCNLSRDGRITETDFIKTCVDNSDLAPPNAYSKSGDNPN